MNSVYQNNMRPVMVRVARKLGITRSTISRFQKVGPSAGKPASPAGKPASPAGKPAHPVDKSKIALTTKSTVSEVVIDNANNMATAFDELSNDSLLKTAEAYRKLGIRREAILCYELLLNRERNTVWAQTLADLYLACGEAEKAYDTLVKLDLNVLTSRGLRIFNQALFSVLRAQGKLPEAYRKLKAADEKDTESSPGVQLKLAEAERQLGRYEDAFERLKAHQRAFGGNASYMLQYASCAGELNRADEALSVVWKLYNTEKPPASIVVRYLQLLWQNGDVAEIYQVLERALKLEMADPNLLKFAREIGYVDQRVETYCNSIAEIIRRKVAKASTVEMGRYARCFLSLDLFPEALRAADIYLQKYNRRADVFLVRGAAHFYLENNDAAKADLLSCVALDPGLSQAHGLLMHLLPREAGGVEAYMELLDKRDESHPKYKTRGEDGRLGILDVERMQSNFMLGDYRTGMRIKQERPVCRFLGYGFPEQYDSFENPEFSKTKKESILIICEDGVGDEIRWAQFYPKLRKHFKRIEALCEPRALSILQRSFPDVVFHPLKRRLMEAPGDDGGKESTWVPYFALARLVDNALYARFSEFSEIRMTSDMVLGMWEAEPTQQPSLKGAGTGSYIKPDQARLKKWEKHFKAEAGPKLKVGLLWRSSLLTPRRKKHYMTIEHLMPLLKVKGVHFVSLQHEHTVEELMFCRAFGIEIPDEADLFDDFEDVAAVTANLDLIVGANSFPAEMGAAVGTPCWLLGVFCNTVRFRLGDSTGEADRLTWNTTIVRVDQENGFQGDLDEMAGLVAKEARGRLKKMVQERG